VRTYVKRLAIFNGSVGGGGGVGFGAETVNIPAGYVREYCL
jgi:hypothetical protein